jgi:hypothetical protein
VTHADQDIWGILARQDAVNRSDTVDAVANRILEAINKKRTRSDRRIILALDATDSPTPALRRVVEAFRSAHGREAAEIGFEQIWIVGPIVDL